MSAISIYKNMQVELIKCEEQDMDYLVVLKRPDGSTVSVLIPKKGEYGEIFPNEVFGLNWVTQGHYL